MRTLETTMTRKQPDDDPRGMAGRGVIRRIAVATFAIAAMAGLGLMLMNLAIDKLSSLSVLRLSGLF